MGLIRRIGDFRFGSLAVVQKKSNAMTALGPIADVRPGRMSALPDTRLSGATGIYNFLRWRSVMADTWLVG